FAFASFISSFFILQLYATSHRVGIKVYQTKLRHYDNVSIAKFARKPVVFHRPKSHATQMYITLTHEIFFQPNFIEN
ncbi:ParA family protein, partial [Mastigocoleus testarum]